MDYQITIIDGKGVEVLKLETDNRAAARGVAIVCKDSGYACVAENTPKPKPRQVKFKGVD